MNDSTTLDGNGVFDPASAVTDDVRNGRFYVDRRVFTDDAIFDLEMKRIFERTWVFLAHESQFKRPNDYVTAWIGRVPVIVNRKPSGEIGGLINSCAHRGAMITRASKGNESIFACPYHGWCYDTDGRNVRVPDREVGCYPGRFDSENHDLVAVPRVASYRGFVWGCLDPEVGELEHYLGETKPFIDLLADLSPNGLEVLRGTSTYTSRANWKLQMENGVDGYHFPLVHASYLMLTQRRAQEGKLASIDVRDLHQMVTGCYDFGNGHAMIWGKLPNPQWRPNYGDRDAQVKQFGEARFSWMKERMRNLLIFPNVQLMDQASTQIRVFRPLSPHATEVKIYCIAPVGESAQDRALRLRHYEDFFNASGLGTPDDLAIFEACQLGYKGAFGRFQQSYDRGIGSMTWGADQEAASLASQPNASGGSITHEVLYHSPYRQWLKLMTHNAESGSGPDRE